MKFRSLFVVICAVSLSAFAVETTKPKVYVEPQGGFETYLVAAIVKKQVPVDVVMDQTKTDYVLKPRR